MTLRPTCAAPECDVLLPEDRHPNQKYCGKTCAGRMARRRERWRKGETDKEPEERVEFVDPRERRTRRGPGYDRFCAFEFGQKLMRGEMSVTDVAEAMDTSKGNVSTWYQTWTLDAELDATGPALRSVDTVNKEAIEGGLVEWRRMMFPKMLTPDFHVEWANLLEETIEDCGRTLLLAPQRHGKSQMLIEMCLKLIVERPNISIGWVSKTADLAETMTGYMRQKLSEPEFIRKTLGHDPRSVFEPGNRSGLPWTNGKFTVATRTEVRKSPTVEALGVGGTIVGRDFDVIVIDDMQDRISCLSPTKRDKNAEWFFTDLNSRKEETTALFFICSRQHEDDVPGRIMADHADEWRIKVYQAHDPACTIDEDLHASHHRSNCLLWPEKRTHDWLMKQKKANPAHYQRNFLNDPTTDQMTYVRASDIADRKADDFQAGMNPGGRLIAGIDPASAKPTAATLWALKDGRRYLVDAMLARPGNEGVRQIISEWRRNFGCSTYMVETNGYQGQIMQDSQVKALIQSLRVQVKPHYSSRMNKWDEGAGVVAMLHKIADPEGGIVLPKGGDERVQERLEQVYRQWIIFDPDSMASKHAPDDLVMASWFPQLEMDRLSKAASNRVVYLEDRTSYGSTSYGAMTAYGSR